MNAIQFAQIRAYSDVGDMLGVYIGPSYNFSARQLQEAEYGARLKSRCDCWAVDFGLTDSFNPNEVQVQFSIDPGWPGIDRAKPVRAQSIPRLRAGRQSARAGGFALLIRVP